MIRVAVVFDSETGTEPPEIEFLFIFHLLSFVLKRIVHKEV
jgi:hypothetical protein